MDWWWIPIGLAAWVAMSAAVALWLGSAELLTSPEGPRPEDGQETGPAEAVTPASWRGQAGVGPRVTAQARSRDRHRWKLPASRYWLTARRRAM